MEIRGLGTEMFARADESPSPLSALLASTMKIFLVGVGTISTASQYSVEYNIELTAVSV